MFPRLSCFVCTWVQGPRIGKILQNLGPGYELEDLVVWTWKIGQTINWFEFKELIVITLKIKRIHSIRQTEIIVRLAFVELKIMRQTKLLMFPCHPSMWREQCFSTPLCRETTIIRVSNQFDLSLSLFVKRSILLIVK